MALKLKLSLTQIKQTSASLVFLCVLFLFSCVKPIDQEQDFLNAYNNSIEETDIIEHIKVLASDEFEGRAPVSKGEQFTLDYLTRQLTNIGFEPGNGDSFFQSVDLIQITADEDMTLTVGDATYAYKDAMVAILTKTATIYTMALWTMPQAPLLV